MPMGVTHRQINTAMSIPLAVGTYAIGWPPTYIVSMLVGYSFATYFMNPDLDLNSIGYQSWGWLRLIWWPYQKILGHRSWISHFPVISTLLRIVYLLWFPVVLIWLLGSSVQAAVRDQFFDWGPTFGPYLLTFVIGMILSDALHAILDVSSTELKQLFGGKRRRRFGGFFEHHNEEPPRRRSSHNHDHYSRGADHSYSRNRASRAPSRRRRY